MRRRVGVRENLKDGGVGDHWAMTRTKTPLAFAAGLVAGVAGARSWESSAVRFARMSGSSIAGPGAAPWITDFLNAAYYRRPSEDRDVDDLRLAFAIVTTRWYRQGGRRLQPPDVLPFHAAFGRLRLSDKRSPRGTLDREQLLEGASRLLGDWFPAAYADDERRGWGIAFATTDEKAAYDPDMRMRLAQLGPLAPAGERGAQVITHTYPPVEVPAADAVIGALAQPETWPDYASAIGRFTPLRPGGLAGQTFEIEVAAGTDAGRPVFQRGYVTITRAVSQEDEGELRAYVDAVNEALARNGEEPAVPEGAEPVFAFDLTCHEGHFLGRGNNRLLLYRADGRTLVRAAGTWEEMPWHIASAYALAGREAQHAFWGQGQVEELSMLHQIGKRLSTAAG
jgi:hypothetical protein